MPLVPVAEDIWIAEGGNVSFHGFPYPTRSVVVRLCAGGVWLWSPIAMTAALQAAIDAIGPVDHLVSPNKIHHLFLADWHAAYPNAKLWGPASTMRKRQDLPFQAALQDEPPAAWDGAFDQAWFRGSMVLDEIVFFHRASHSVILADLSENFSVRWLRENWAPWQRPVARLGGIVEGKGYAPIDWRMTFLDRRPLRAARDKMLGWDGVRVIMAHGEWQRDGGRQYLQRAFAWVG